MLCSIIPSRQRHTKNNERLKKDLYNCIIQHSQVVHPPIENQCRKVTIESHYETQIVPKLLPQVYIKELHNIMLIPTEESGIEEAVYVENNMIITESTIRNILSPQLRKISAQNKILCCCECCIFAQSMCSYLLSWRDYYKKNQTKATMARSRFWRSILPYFWTKNI